MANSKLLFAFSLHLVLALFVLDLANAQGLKLEFYKKSCPSAEYIIKKTTKDFISRTPTLAAPLLRMHFHDCFVRVRSSFLLSFFVSVSFIGLYMELFFSFIGLYMALVSSASFKMRVPSQDMN